MTAGELFKWLSVTAVSLCFARRVLRHYFPAPPELVYYGASKRLEKVLKQVPSLTNGYRPPPLLPGGVLQSAIAEMFHPPKTELQFVREVVHLPELVFSSESTTMSTGPKTRSKSASAAKARRSFHAPAKTRCCPDVVPTGETSIDWLGLDEGCDPEFRSASDNLDSRSICVIVPGLTGSSTSAYVRRTACAVVEAGGIAAVYNPRSRGGNHLSTPFLYSAGYTEDLRRTLNHVHDRFTGIPVTLVGFSLGANVVAKYVGEEREGCRLAGAVALAAPIDCISMSNWLLTSWTGKLLDPILVGAVHKVLHEIEHVFHGHDHIDVHGAKTAKTMSEFDKYTIAPMMGCRSASAYYREASSGNNLGDIRVPTLFLSANNDPIVPAHLIRRDDFYAAHVPSDGMDDDAHSVMLAVTDEGGHSMVYPEGWTVSQSWTTRVVTEYIEAVSSDYVSRNPFGRS